jgi:hypothetical protein
MAAMTTFIGLKMSPELAELLRTTAARKNTTVSALMRRALLTGLKFE